MAEFAFEKFIKYEKVEKKKGQAEVINVSFGDEEEELAELVV